MEMTPELVVEILRASEQECWLNGWDKGAAVDYVYNLASKWVVKAPEKDPCEDSVSRQAALGALNCEISGRIESDIDLCKYKREFQEFADMILKSQEKAIQALPSVTPTHSGWIPVDERPPEDGEKILMSTIHFGVITGVYDSECDFLTHYSISSADMASVEVIAWMPLPESYEAEMESEN